MFFAIEGLWNWTDLFQLDGFCWRKWNFPSQHHWIMYAGFDCCHSRALGWVILSFLDHFTPEIGEKKNVISHSGSEGLSSPSPALLSNDWCFMTFLSRCCSGCDLYWMAHQGMIRWGACLLSFKPPVPIPPLPSAGLTLSLFPHLTFQPYLLL